MHECPYCKKLEAYNFGDYLGKTEHWIIFLAPNQSNLGTCVIALTRHHPTLTGLSNEEWEEFIELVEKMENAVKKAFQATLVNWGCLMNSFYLENNPDPHLHWHFIPRYQDSVEFAGQLFEDPHFGYMRPRPLKKISHDVREKILNKIKEYM
ncbi:MAG: HIT family protein [Euryarchaeota archaeon]|jgi:diadenosine tetraphosphate (Ap4A) HIT family hydrolase|nr:HIT family protein [Euryarchaeota archaeon]